MHMRQLLTHSSVRTLPHRARSFCLQCRLISARHMSESTASSNSTTFHVLAPLEQSTRRLAAILAEDARRGDCICLHGDVGAGKSAFSRAYIRALAQDEDLPVPSPTYLLQNTYDETEGTVVHHFDLYRLRGQDDLGRLDMGKALSTGVCLIEWPERLEDQAPPQRLAVHISMLPEEERQKLVGEEKQLVHGVELAESAGGNAEDSIDEEAYVDRKWRKIVLQPFGDAWRERCRAICTLLQRCEADPSLHYLL